MTPRIPEPDPGPREGTGHRGSTATHVAGTAAADPSAHAHPSPRGTVVPLPGTESVPSARRPEPGLAHPRPPAHAAPPDDAPRPLRQGPVTVGTVGGDGVPPADEEALVEAGIAELWDGYADAAAAGEPEGLRAARDRLVLHYAPLVKYVAGRVGTGLPSHVDVADLIQSGIFGLVDAIERFEPERGRKFEGYAMQRIRGAILDELRAQDWVPRSVRSRAREIERAIERLESRQQRTCSDVELAGELGMRTPELRSVFGQIAMTSVAALDELIAAGRGGTAGAAGPSLADSLPDTSVEDPVSAMESQETRRLLAEAVQGLAERDRTVVGLYYFENLTLAEIGRVLGVTESRVCQLHTRAVMRLRTRLAEISGH